jgi:hypothetical protein
MIGSCFKTFRISSGTNFLSTTTSYTNSENLQSGINIIERLRSHDAEKSQFNSRRVHTTPTRDCLKTSLLPYQFEYGFQTERDENRPLGGFV